MDWVALVSGLFGLLIGWVAQYFINIKVTNHQLQLTERSKLYIDLFHNLRDLSNDTISIHNLICEAQLYASDEVLDILKKIRPGESFNDSILYDLLVAFRNELRPDSKKRELNVFVHDRSRNA